MSADVVIRAEGLGKKYVIGHQSSERVPTFRDAIVRNVNQFARTTADILRGKPLIAGDEVEEFWALKDVSFEIKRGDVVGVIGRNGAGKSTLLKVLSRITEPSEGRVEIKGRVASLLEVGTGFHPELTGRENIYLNGAILGMTREEIRSKFDEIVAFAEIERFLDTPVKRYSSGMYVRLAFAVAAHLEPEILIVDEVLAVGDAEFQKKCLGKMQDVAGKGRTVLLVSHNMGTIRSLCISSILLRGGRVSSHGSTSDTIASYLEDAKLHIDAEERNIGGATFRIALNNRSIISASPTRDMLLSMTMFASRPIHFSEFALVISSMDSARIGIIDFRTFNPSFCISGQITAFIRMSTPTLVRGLYQLKLWLASENTSMNVELGTLEIIEAGDLQSAGLLTRYKPEVNGAALFFGSIEISDLHSNPAAF